MPCSVMKQPVERESPLRPPTLFCPEEHFSLAEEAWQGPPTAQSYTFKEGIRASNEPWKCFQTLR